MLTIPIPQTWLCQHPQEAHVSCQPCQLSVPAWQCTRSLAAENNFHLLPHSPTAQRASGGLHLVRPALRVSHLDGPKSTCHPGWASIWKLREGHRSMLIQAVSRNLILAGMGLRSLFPWLSVEDVSHLPKAAALNTSCRPFIFKGSNSASGLSSFPSPGFPFCLQSEKVFSFWEMISFHILFLYKIRNSEPPRNPGEKQEGCIRFAFFEVIISKPQLVVIAPQWMGLERWDHVPEHIFWALISPSVEWDSPVFRVSWFSLSLFPSTLPLSFCLPWKISVNLSSSSPLSLDAILKSFWHGPPESHQQSTGVGLGA